MGLMIHTYLDGILSSSGFSHPTFSLFSGKVGTRLTCIWCHSMQFILSNDRVNQHLPSYSKCIHTIQFAFSIGPKARAVCLRPSATTKAAYVTSLSRACADCIVTSSPADVRALVCYRQKEIDVISVVPGNYPEVARRDPKMAERMTIRASLPCRLPVHQALCRENLIIKGYVFKVKVGVD